MRITRLWISEYKNIKNLELKFKEDYLITLLIGQNGLGKSNLIEILALIFRDLHLINNEEELVNWAFNPQHFEYEIDYECHSKQIRIKCYQGIFKVFLKISNSYSEIPIFEFLKNRIIHYLPDYIIGYYSGENKRVRSIIKKHEVVQFDFLKSFQRRKNIPNTEKIRRLFFTESNHSQLVLLTLAIYQNVPEFRKPIKQLLTSILKIEDIKNFSIKFNSPNWYKPDKRKDGIENLISNMLPARNKKDKIEFPFWGLKGKIDRLLTELYNIQIELSVPLSYIDERITGREIIQFDNINLRRFSESIKEYFPHPIDFFYALEGSSIIGSLNSIEVRVQKRNGEAFEFEQMSEGEQQLLTVLGIVLITGKDDCLILLDEPDTHLNPKWQRDYVDLLKEFDVNGGRSNMIVATHSPLIVQSSKDSNVVLFYEKWSGHLKAEVSEIPFHTWRIDHVLTSHYFGLSSARPKDSRIDEFMSLRERLLSQEKKLTRRETQLLKKHQDDFGLFPTGETFLDMTAMHFIRSETKKYDQNKKKK